jgi:hypothetical protein
VRETFLALVQFPAVKHRLGEKWTRILQVLTSCDPNYRSALNILGHVPLEERHESEISPDPEVIRLSALITALKSAAGSNKDLYWRDETDTKWFLEFLEEPDDDARSEWILDSYRNMRKAMMSSKSSSEWVKRMHDLLAFPSVDKRIRQRLLPLAKLLDRYHPAFTDALRALGRPLKLSSRWREIKYQ